MTKERIPCEQQHGGEPPGRKLNAGRPLFWIRLGYRIWHGTAQWFSSIILMRPLVRHHLVGAVALVLYLWIVWGFTLAFDFTWRAHLIAGLITAGMLLIMHRVEVACAP